MRFEPLVISGAFRIHITPSSDERGFFARRFCADTFRSQGLKTDFVQRSISYNVRRGVLRGLHFQAAPHGETKLVRCIRGGAFDVLVDLRASSPTYGRWHGEEITAENRTILYIPEGVAHGFQTLVDDTEIDYEITPDADPALARGVRFDDPALAIPWPVANPILNDRDRAWPGLAGVTYG